MMNDERWSCMYDVVWSRMTLYVVTYEFVFVNMASYSDENVDFMVPCVDIGGVPNLAILC